MSESTHIVVTPKVFVAVLISLLAGTGLTTWAALQNLGIWNPIIALAIATFEAAEVALYFMFVKYSTRLTLLAIAACFFLFSTLISLSLVDYMGRAWGSW
jgi:cytochrome c oxidase subunit 4